ncbi:MAG: PEGA domain-containing protein [Candidatus Pacebacteria bacterium]|nr:PEGA domain-containing protein [Candidatus Paceibacterota bacterium]
MNAKSPTPVSETRNGYWRRVLRPLFWWLFLVLVLLAIHQHQLAMERTRLYCSITMYETNAVDDAVGTLDGHRIGNGDKISLGSHRFTITETKAESFTTNFFAWYGRHDFGRINLKRAMGTLNVTAEPAARVITITGPEFSLTLNDSTGTNLLVPTDRYRVGAQYARWSNARDYDVTAGNITPCLFAPQLGVISVTCNELPAAFELQDTNGNVVEKGDVPAVMTELPAGRYSVLVTHHDHALRQETVVSAKGTNDVAFHFAFGAARFESVPPGAKVLTTNGLFLGTTPVVVTELPPSTADYRLQLDGYDAVTVSVTVAEAQTNAASATLVNLSYLGSMRTARQDMADGNYRNALNSLEQALIAKPGDADALHMQMTAKGREMVQEAKTLASQGDYVEAGKKLQVALDILPDDAETKGLQSEYETHEAGQLAQVKAKLTREIFDRDCADHPVAGLFREHSVVITNYAPEAVRDAFVQNFEAVPPTLKVTLNRSPESGVCELFLLQASSNPLVTARRECVMVIGSTDDGKVAVFFKVIEFQKRVTGNAVNLILAGRNQDDWIPLHPSKIQMTPAFEEQIRAGVRMMQDKMVQSVGRGQ